MSPAGWPPKVPAGYTPHNEIIAEESAAATVAGA